MKTRKLNSVCLIYFVTALLLLPFSVEAQRMQHGSGNTRTNQNISRPSTQQNKSINGGYQKSANRNTKTKAPSNKTSTMDTKNKGNVNSRDKDARVSNDVNNVDRNRNNVDRDKDRDVNINRDINVDRNVNIDRDVYVRRPVVAYPRPPYTYGGHRYYAFHPYHYHPYHPFYWGPAYHPWGFFIAVLTVTAIVITVENQQYHYDQGVYYQKSDSGYKAVPAPNGAKVDTLPPNTQTVVVNETTNNYYYGGTFYEKSDSGYTVVPPTAGTVVENLPEGGEEVKIGDVTYVKLGEVYYQPIQKDGKNMYEVVNVEKVDSSKG